jgi:hypothetical protein
MRLIRAITGVVGCLVLSASWAAAAPLTFQVVVNTTPLVGNAAGPFALDFQLNDGSGLSDGNNTATISDFSFTGAGAGPTGLPSRVGGATGSLSSTVSLTDSGFLNEFFQGFTAGNSLRFLVTLTSNVDAGLAPDAFSFAILDRNLLNVATTGLGDSLLLVDITRANLGLADVRTFTSTSPVGVTATATAVPEPVSLLLLGVGAVGLGLRGRRQGR